MKTRVLFLCTGNSCRSQMAHGWLTQLAGDRYEVYSAGLETHGVNPYAIRVMAEKGVDISSHTSNAVSDYLGESFGLLVTVCGGAKEACPLFAGEVKERRHWPFDDPAGALGSEEEILAAFRRVRDEIRHKIDTFLKESKA
jgi:arsenate reductase